MRHLPPGSTVSSGAPVPRSATGPDTLVSIVVNNYNYGRFVAAAVDSALAQRWPRTEVVVVDDGSTDDSRAVLAAYGDRIRLVLKENGGQASAVNAGFAASRGDVVIFLDADDRLDPEAAEAVARAASPGVAKVQYALRVVDARGEELGYRVPRERMPSGDLRRRVLEVGVFPSPPTSGNAFPRWVLERLLPVPEADWTIGPDAYLLLLAPLLGEVVSIHRPLGAFRDHGDNHWAMRAVTPERLRSYLAYDARRVRLMRGMQDRLGFRLVEPWLEGTPSHLQTRLASLRLDPGGHPRPEDRRSTLARAGLAALARDRSLGGRKRLLFAAWFVLVAALPRALVGPLIEASYVDRRQPALLRALLGKSRPAEPRRPLVGQAP